MIDQVEEISSKPQTVVLGAERLALGKEKPLTPGPVRTFFASVPKTPAGPAKTQEWPAICVLAGRWRFDFGNSATLFWMRTIR